MEINFRQYPFPRKRPRHHISTTAYIPFSQLKVIPENYPVPLEKINWNNVFLNGKPPNFLDIGTGRGKFLLEFAVNNPNLNILGFEIKRQVVDWLKRIIQMEDIVNAGLIWYNILNGLEFIESESIEGIFYLFPDPWPKARHHKRRALNLSVLQEFFRTLKAGGKIYFATDKPDVHNYHIELLKKFDKFSYYEISNESQWNFPKTNKQISCENRGIAYFRLIASKNK